MSQLLDLYHKTPDFHNGEDEKHVTSEENPIFSPDFFLPPARILSSERIPVKEHEEEQQNDKPSEEEEEEASSSSSSSSLENEGNKGYKFQNTVVGHYQQELAQEALLLQQEEELKNSPNHTVAAPAPWSISKLLDFARDRTHWMLFLTIVGILAGGLSLLMDMTDDQMYFLHLNLVKYVPYYPLKYLVWIAYTLAFLIVAIVFTVKVSPAAVGSGLPELKCILSGVVIARYLSFRTMIAKYVGLGISLGCGMVIGKDGPFAHFVCCLCNILMKYVPLFRGIREYEALRMQMLNAAIAAGVSGTFGSPIGGLLYSIEVTSTYYPVRNYWYSAFTSFVAAFTYRIFNNLRLGKEIFNANIQTNYNTAEVLSGLNEFDLMIAIALGIFGGIMGALFVRSAIWVVYIRRTLSLTGWRIFKSPYPYSIFVGIMTAVLSFPDLAGDYMALPPSKALKDLFSGGPLSAPGLNAKQWTDIGQYFSLPFFGLSRYVLVIMTISLPIPCGLFFPAFCFGASFSRMLGQWVMTGTNRIPQIPGIYATMGAAAVGCGITHAYSAVPIVLELTGQLVYILPVCLSSVVSIAISRRFGYNIFESVLISRKLPYLPDIFQPRVLSYTASDIMDRSIVEKQLFLTQRMRFIDAVERLNQESYIFDHFVVVEEPESLIVRGTISKLALKKFLEEHQSEKLRLLAQVEEERLLEPSQGPRSTFQTTLNSLASAISTVKSNFRESKESSSSKLPISENRSHHLADDLLDLPSEHTLIEMHSNVSIQTVHHLFIVLRLKTALVTKNGRLLGLLTRERLRAAITPPRWFFEKDPTQPQ